MSSDDPRRRSVQPPVPHIVVGKMEAARRQLRTAIRMWFHAGDPVSIHMLAHSSHEIIHRLYRNRGFDDLLFDNKRVKPEFRREYALSLKAASGFFKHADQDDEPGLTLDFDPNLNELFIAMSVIALRTMGEEQGIEMFCFLIYEFLHNPGWFPDEVFDRILPVDAFQKLRPIDKAVFMQAIQEGIDRNGLSLN